MKWEHAFVTKNHVTLNVVVKSYFQNDEAARIVVNDNINKLLN